jgi:nicotinate phosphoribosyltransferase
MTQFDKRNITMMMDFYELTMANGYFINHDQNKRAVFDVFYRKNPDNGGFAIFAGLEQIVEYIENLHFSAEDIAYLRSLNMFDEGFLDYLSTFRFTGDIYSFTEGTIMYPNEPIITVIAPVIEAQIVETAILTQLNHQSLIATKANRIVRAARGKMISDMGARRAHNMDAAVYGARAAYIGGVVNTATVLAAQNFDIPVVGTMAHSWVMFYESEYEAFRLYAQIYKEKSVLLVDTYNTLESGVPNAIRIAKEVLAPMGVRLKGIRIDSGDIAYLSKKSRAMLDEAGLQDCIIVGSNSLDEFTITSILDQGGCIDSFGVGERLINSQSNATFGAVYKLVAIEENGTFVPKIKLSENIEKITNPGLKHVYRIYGQNSEAVADLLTNWDENVPNDTEYHYVDPKKPWKKRAFMNCKVRELQHPVFKDGKRCCELKPLRDIRDYVRQQLDHEIWQEEQRFDNPHEHYLDMSQAYYDMKMNLLMSSK